MSGPVQSAGSAPFGGRVFNGPATGPSPEDFYKTPGIWQTLYNEAAIKIGLPQVKADAKSPPNGLVIRELDRQNHVFHAQSRGPAAHAQKLVTEARIPGIFSDSVDTPRLAAEIVALRRDAPALAPQVEREVMSRLGNAGDQSRFADDLRAAASHGAAADQKLQASVSANYVPPAAPTRAKINADTNALIIAASTTTSDWKTGITTTNFSVASIAAAVAERAETDPIGAQVIRAELTARLSPQEGDQLNRLLAGKGGFFENIGVAVYDPVDGTIGAIKGLGNDAIAIANVVSRGEMLRVAGEADQAAALQSVFGNEDGAKKLHESADILRKASQTDAIPSIPYSNAAQQGGANTATVVELAGGVKMVYSGGKWVIRNAPELLAKRSDDVAKAAETLLDRGRRILGDMPLNSESLDDLYQAGKLSMDEARALAKSVGWKDKDGWSIYPPNDGVAGPARALEIPKGSKIDRYGGRIDARSGEFIDTGRFTSPVGTNYDARALAPVPEKGIYKKYEVLKPIPSEVGNATPWFDEIGGGLQYKTDLTIDQMIKANFIREIN